MTPTLRLAAQVLQYSQRFVCRQRSIRQAVYRDIRALKSPKLRKKNERT